MSDHIDLERVRRRADKYGEHPGTLRCCNAHDTADDVPALLTEIDRLRRENAALQQLVTRAEQDIATLTRDRDQALEESAPAPRDTDLTQQVRALVKRYGAPVIAAEAARQAKHH